ncbi:SRPBCC family protein [Saccharospirillum mangrovi]|uniref:SRPBCC family protein n=1 Tax=Saccharospirillum mangrovi TaxID=2161747 RepID=UPI000D3544CA|nr:SRPBCC family protein [Saccharospirillum mangrovi]
MSQAVEHTVFTLERWLATSPRHAFRFWSDANLKARWNECHPDWTVIEDSHDFKVGGEERKRWQTIDGQEQTFTAHYLDIVPEQRIIYAYEMSFAGKRLSASLVTITLTPKENETRMIYTEQVVLLDSDDPDARQHRVHGTEHGLDRLVEIVADE